MPTLHAARFGPRRPLDEAGIANKNVSGGLFSSVHNAKLKLTYFEVNRKELVVLRHTTIISCWRSP